MVDSIGAKAVTTQDRPVVPVRPTAQPANAAARQSETVQKQLELSALAFDFGKQPPVDTKRVEQVRQAISEGTYTLRPETIADRLLALKQSGNPKK
ncbi:MAG: flagellar biosynthesis anti-sigma factor FlgM [Sphingomonas sp.]|jgi:negative regulator of flagellin synthesis FlgM|uniref:flagellar biosynthesis anti-sigma factor FlgM n=1 Tax=Sphingomonas sp. TaxID=28214 RepID=UPI003567F3F4